MESLSASFDYEWKPFMLDGKHLSFIQHVNSRLEHNRCSHWGSAIYRWEGKISQGPHSNLIGVLIGETKDLRQRIKQYVSGTQERGNKLWRESFLEKGDIRLYVLEFAEMVIKTEAGNKTISSDKVLSSENMRLVLEQLLVQKEVSNCGDTRWVVNARQ